MNTIIVYYNLLETKGMKDKDIHLMYHSNRNHLKSVDSL